MNNDYISREAVIVELCNILCGIDPQECQLQIPHDGAEHCTTIGAILAIPAADVVPRDWHNRCMEIEIQNRIAADVRPVVLCRDCIYDDNCFAQSIFKETSWIPFDKNKFFCPDGKRREGGASDG